MADTEKGYNGWTNYETWNVALWIDNEEGAYRYWQAATLEAWENAPADENTRNRIWTRSETARFRLADQLKEELEKEKPDLGATMWADLLGAALQEVNWQEIADNWLSEVDGYKPRK